MLEMPKELTIKVKKIKIENASLYEASCSEFPDLFDYGDTALEAWELMIDSLDTTIEIIKEKQNAKIC